MTLKEAVDILSEASLNIKIRTNFAGQEFCGEALNVILETCTKLLACEKALLGEKELIRLAQKFCRETYDMSGEKEECCEKFGALICFIKDVLVKRIDLFITALAARLPTKQDMTEAANAERQNNPQWNIDTVIIAIHALLLKSLNDGEKK